MIPIVSPVYNNVNPSSILVNLFLRWSNDNEISCNTDKCKELIVRKKCNDYLYQPVSGIPQCTSLFLLGLTLPHVT